MGIGHLVIILIIISVSFIPVFAPSHPEYVGVDTEFILECSTWYESYELTSKPEFIMVWGKGAITCYDMLDLWIGKLFLWHNENLITDEELETAIAYLVQKGHIVFS